MGDRRATSFVKWAQDRWLGLSLLASPHFRGQPAAPRTPAIKGCGSP